MGPILPKPVTTKVIERKGNTRFRVGVACMNGMRESMEDDHCMELHDDWGFFGVYDGHVGPEAAIFMAKKFPERLRAMKMPVSDEDMKKLALELDAEFLETKSMHGSTGTFFLTRPTSQGRYELQVGNVGDSRVIVCSGGVAYPMTDDHKPDKAEEKERILAAGGSVSNSRVDGKLAVSRAFGDAEYKSGDSQLTHKVIALPDMTHHECGPDDYVFLSCDGVFESNFSNEEVIAFINEKLKTTNDLGVVAASVCDEALDRGSKDNITAMVVQLCGGSDYEKLPSDQQKVPLLGPYSAPDSTAFRKAFMEMLEPFKMPLHEALERRYDFVVEHLPLREKQTNLKGDKCDLQLLTDSELRAMYQNKTDTEAAAHFFSVKRASLIEGITEIGAPYIPVDILEMREELANFTVQGGKAPPAKGSPDRKDWFMQWIEEQEAKVKPDSALTLEGIMQSSGLPLSLIQQVIQANRPQNQENSL